MGNYKRGSGNYKSSYLTTTVKTSNQTVNNDTTFQSDTQMVHALKPNRTYSMFFPLMFSSNATADIKVKWLIPTGASGKMGRSQSSPQVLNSITSSTILGGTNGNTNRCCVLYGFIIMGSTAGNMQFEWAQGTADVSDTIVLQGTQLILTEEG